MSFNILITLEIWFVIFVTSPKFIEPKHNATSYLLSGSNSSMFIFISAASFAGSIPNKFGILSLNKLSPHPTSITVLWGAIFLSKDNPEYSHSSMGDGSHTLLKYSFSSS